MNSEQLNSYLPDGAFQFIEKWLENHSIVLKITRKRETKLGDYRKVIDQNRHQITINGDLNPYAFFFVMTHEIAHLKTFVQFDRKTINPHGKEWKHIFGNLLHETLAIYPEEMRQYISHHAKNPKASIGADSNLCKYVINNIEKHQFFLEELEYGTLFSLSNKVFIKESKQKSRFICSETKTKKRYLVSGVAVVNKV